MSSEPERSPPAGRGPEAGLAKGATIGRYVVLGLLGRGGMGEVYAAYDPELDRKIAVKLLRARGGEQTADGSARLALDAQRAPLLARRAHQLERHLPPRHQVQRRPDLAHAAAPEQPLQAKAPRHHHARFEVRRVRDRRRERARQLRDEAPAVGARGQVLLRFRRRARRQPPVQELEDGGFGKAAHDSFIL